MTPILKQILLYALIPTLALLGGGAVALSMRFGGKVRSAILHFAVGVVFSVVAVEILPDVVRLHEPWITVLGFSAGIVLMLVVRSLTQSPTEAELPDSAPGKLPIPFVIAIGIDILIDGLLLGIGFSAGTETGVLLALALGVEVLSLGWPRPLPCGRTMCQRAESSACWRDCPYCFL